MELHYTIITLFLSEIGERTYFMTLGRSAFFDRRTYAYKAICFMPANGNPPEPELRGFEMKDIPFYFVTENSLPENLNSGSCFIYDFDHAVLEISKGKNLEREMSKNNISLEADIDLATIEAVAQRVGLRGKSSDISLRKYLKD